MIRVALGQDSHRFEDCINKPLILGGCLIEGERGLKANSDGDVLLHAVTNAISGLTGRNILGPVADDMCRAGVRDSAAYLREAMKDLKAMGGTIIHLSLSIEAKHPYFAPLILPIKESLAALLGIDMGRIGLTATSGEGLTAFGRGEGIQVLCIITADLPGEA